MKVFLVNLPQDKERLANVDARLRELRVFYERVNGVYGADVSGEGRHQLVNQYRWWCAVGRPMTDGELGCALSHAKIYRKIVELGLPCACVLEDDVVLDDRFPMVLNAVAERANAEKSQVFLLSNHSMSDGQIGNEHEGYRTKEGMVEPSFIRSDGDFYTEGYVVTLRAAEMLLRVNVPIKTPCDWWFRWAKLGAIELYHAFPTVCYQNKTAYQSHTENQKALPVSEWPLCEYCWHKFSRVVGKGIDAFLMCILGT